MAPTITTAPRRRSGRVAGALGAVVAMIAAMLVTVAAGQAAAADCNPFPDVDASNEHCANIAWLKDQRITKPTGSNFDPLGDVSRGQMTAFLFRLQHPGQGSPACDPAAFPDVDASDKFCGFIGWASKTGLAKGYPDGKFRSENTVTRGAMSAFIYRMANSHGAAPCTAAAYTDVPASQEFCGTITWMKGTGITTGVDANNYGVARSVTRQAMASFIKRLDTTAFTGSSVSRVSPFAANGSLRLAVSADIPDWAGGDLSELCSPTPLSQHASVFTCGPNAEGLQACWDVPADSALYCLHNADDTTLVKLPYTVPPTVDHGDAAAMPWKIVLTGGAVCHYRQGGGIGAPATPNFYYSYYCNEKGPQPGLVSPTDSDAILQGAVGEQWYAYAENGDGILTTVGIKAAVFVGH